MKKSLLTFFVMLFMMPCFSLKAQIDYDTYFTDNQLRIDYYLYGNADTVMYALDKLVKEPKWGGPRKQLIDKSNYGVYLFTWVLPSLRRVADYR